MVRRVLKVSRGIRNNNPFNLVRSSSLWRGKIPFHKSTDSKFEQFSTMEYGLRAGLLNLCNRYFRDGYCTISDLVRVYAPSNENDVSSYMKFLCELVFSHYSSELCDTKIYFRSPEFFSLCLGILRYESNYVTTRRFLESLCIKFGIF